MKNRRTVVIVVAGVALGVLALVLTGCHFGMADRGYGRGYGYNGHHQGHAGHAGHAGHVQYYVAPPGGVAPGAPRGAAPAAPPPPPPPAYRTGYPTKPSAGYGPARNSYGAPQQHQQGYCPECEAQKQRSYAPRQRGW